MNGQDRAKVTIRFPNLLVVPALSAACACVKACGGTDAGWLYVLFLFPLLLYFAWCAGYCALALAGTAVAKAYAVNNSVRRDGADETADGE